MINSYESYLTECNRINDFACRTTITSDLRAGADVCMCISECECVCVCARARASCV